jgi:hypothetical protein
MQHSGLGRASARKARRKYPFTLGLLRDDPQEGQVLSPKGSINSDELAQVSIRASGGEYAGVRSAAQSDSCA